MEYLKQVIHKCKKINLVDPQLIIDLKNFDLNRLIKSKKIIYAFLTLGLIAIMFDLKKPNETKNSARSATQIDTFIPEGFVLVPIEIQNFDALDALLGAFGVVDIYSNKNKKILSSVKLIRAPLNPKQFAVLLSDDISPKLMSEPGPYFVMVQNPKSKSENKIKTETKTKIIYEDIL